MLNFRQVCIVHPPNLLQEITTSDITSKMAGKILKISNINPNLVDLKCGFSENATTEKTDSKGRQSQITFVRQVISLCLYPELFKSDSIPDDAKSRAEQFLECLPAKAIGSYSLNPGIKIARENVAKYVSLRDGHDCNASEIVTMTGAIEGISCFVELFSSGGSQGLKTGIMVPVPADPNILDIMQINNIHVISYHLNEEKDGGLDRDDLSCALQKERENCLPKMILVVNPNYPTGQVLSRKDIETVIKFAYENNLIILVDESYQSNVYQDGGFLSLKKVLMEMAEDYKPQALISLNSVSNGFMRENGFRGGYAEIINLTTDVWTCLFELLSAQHVPVTGQIALDVMANPPVLGEPSYDLFMEETQNILSSLASKARYVSNLLQCLENVNCTTVESGLTAFPKIIMPKKAVLAAKKQGMQLDVFYCSELKKACSISALPGKLYGIDGNDVHICISFDVDDVENVFQKFKHFHDNFMEIYRY